jgi:hypothetical protein
MGTYDYAIGNTAPKWNDVGRLIRLQQVMNSAAIIASNATLTAAGLIAANDIIQCINVPAGFVVLHVGVHISTVGTTGSTVDIGLAGGTEVVAALDVATATGYAVIEKDATWGWDNTSKLFTAADTIDVQYLQNETVGQFTLTVTGYQL